MYRRFKEVLPLGRFAGENVDARVDAAESTAMESWLNRLESDGWELVQIDSKTLITTTGEITCHTPLDYEVHATAWMRRS